MTDILIHSSFGKDDAAKASVPFIIGGASAARDGETRMFLTHAAIYMATKGGNDGIQGDGYKPLGELVQAYVDNGFIGEETGGATGAGGYWVVDPIDGTANYLRGFRHWGVSIAYVSGGVTNLGIVHDSPTNRLYHARLAHGAYCDDDPIKVAATRDPHATVGILGASRRRPVEEYLAQIKALYDAGIEHRKIGSAAIGLVRVAEGVADFYYEGHLNSWDALAAVLIGQEAGAHVDVPDMDDFIADGGSVLCATPALFDQVSRLLSNGAGDRK